MASRSSVPPKASGSQCSGSASGDVTVPNPTPLTEALDSEVVDPPPEIDFLAMARTLATIAETLNESADEAMFPTPPINTPCVTSPATSITYRYHNTRSRGMSTIGDRLAKAVAEGRKFYHDSDIMSNSGSIRSSVPADDESDSMSDLLSDGGGNQHDSESILFDLPCPSLRRVLSSHRTRLASRQSCRSYFLHLKRPDRQASRAIQQQSCHREYQPNSYRHGKPSS